MALHISLAIAVLALLLLPSPPLGPRLIRCIRIKHPNRLGYLRSVFSLVQVGCLKLVFGLLAHDGVISPMLGWLWLFLFGCSPYVRFRTLPRIRPRLLQPIRSRIRHPTPSLFPCSVSRDASHSQVRHIEVTQPERTQELSQLVQTKRLGEDVGSLPIRRNIPKFDFTRKDTFTDKVVVHLNVLGSCVEDGVLRELDAAEVVAVDRRRI